MDMKYDPIIEEDKTEKHSSCHHSEQMLSPEFGEKVLPIKEAEEN